MEKVFGLLLILLLVIIAIVLFMPNDYRVENNVFASDTIICPDKYGNDSIFATFLDTTIKYPFGKTYVYFTENKNNIMDSITIVFKRDTIYSKSFKNMNEDIVALWYAIQIINGAYKGY